jgi:hypothetical protein
MVEIDVMRLEHDCGAMNGRALIGSSKPHRTNG